MGMDPDEFWNHSPNEIYDILDAKLYREKQEEKRRIDKIFTLAQVITRYMFPKDENTKPPHPWDYYPDLFEEEKERYEKSEEDTELDDFKARRKAFYKRFNDQKRREVKE